MYRTVDISKNKYEELNKKSIFFLKFYENIKYDSHGNKIDYSKWRSLEPDLNISFDAGNFSNRDLGYALCIIDNGKEEKDIKGAIIANTINMTFHSATGDNIKDWIYIFNNFISRSKNTEDKFAFMELLWALDKLSWNKNIFTSIFANYSSQTIPFLLTSLQKYGKLLSYNKQLILRDFCTVYNFDYIIYNNNIIKQAYKCIPEKKNQLTVEKKVDYNTLNIYSIIDAVFEQNTFEDCDEQIVNSNSLLKIHTWLHNELPLDDYNILIYFYPFFSEDLKLLSIKRYFHDLRNKHLILDKSFLSELKENKHDEISRCRCSIESPTEPIDLTVSLLIDTLLTLEEKKGKSFQTFDGVLDFAMTHCDIVHPLINFELNKFITACNGGAVYNAGSFKGFIDYDLILKLNEEMLTAKNLHNSLISILDKYAERLKYPACKFGDDSIIPTETFQHCIQKRVINKKNESQSQQSEWQLECWKYLYYPDRWIMKHENIEYIKAFLKDENIQPNPNYNISLDMFSIDKLKAYIRNIPNDFKKLADGEYLINSFKKSDIEKDIKFYLAFIYSDVRRMRIYPQNGALIGSNFDVFGFWKDIKKTLSQDALQNRDSEEYKKAYKLYLNMEAKEVRQRCIESLKKELNTDIINDRYFELHYNRDVLRNIISRFYHKDSFNEKDKDNQHEFLTQSGTGYHYVQLCAPQLSNKKNPAINLPYFWCRGKECFHNNLNKQVLQEESKWKNYSLYHMAEILGYPMLHKTEGGYEPEQAVWQFIAIANKVMQKFKHLKCRSCGHMLFTDKSSGFNRYNYYTCINPTCSERGKVIYLNFCFNCKIGLIDSRDTKQCPNDWYICPRCLSCCNDEQYKRQAQRYILTQKTIPLRIQEKMGHGHNNNNKYFCPHCGGEIIEIEYVHGNISKMCKDCGISYDEQLL